MQLERLQNEFILSRDSLINVNWHRNQLSLILMDNSELQQRVLYLDKIQRDLPMAKKM